MSDDYWRKPSTADKADKPSSFGRPTRGTVAADDAPAAAASSSGSASSSSASGSSFTGDDTATRPAVSEFAAKAKGALGAARDKAASAAARATSSSSAASSASAVDTPTAAPVPSRAPRTAASTSSTTSTTAAVKETAAASTPNRRTRKARLRLSRIDPWSVMKTSFLFGIAGGIIFFVAVWVLWGVIGASGVFESVNTAVNNLLATPGSANNFRLEDYLNTNKILGFTAMIAAADVVIFTALATLFSFLYNLSATVLGGLEVTLAED